MSNPNNTDDAAGDDVADAGERKKKRGFLDNLHLVNDMFEKKPGFLLVGGETIAFDERSRFLSIFRGYLPNFNCLIMAATDEHHAI